jgi:hypothetical protein
LVINHNGQQNGIILGNGCAMFLSKVSSEIKNNYDDLCDQNKLNSFKMNKKFFNESIATTLEK